MGRPRRWTTARAWAWCRELAGAGEQRVRCAREEMRAAHASVRAVIGDQLEIWAGRRLPAQPSALRRREDAGMYRARRGREHKRGRTAALAR